jgi:hypothetical protein
VAQQLQLTHFVDDTKDNLDSVSQILKCKCFQFVRNGVGNQATAAHFSGSAIYPVVPNWEVLVPILLGPS